jgi:triacylglycerol lipase
MQRCGRALRRPRRFREERPREESPKSCRTKKDCTVRSSSRRDAATHHKGRRGPPPPTKENEVSATLSPRSLLRLPLPPIWREARVPLDVYRLTHDPLFVHPPRAATGDPVLLIPGFLTGDMHLGTMRRWLERCGHPTEATGMHLNVDCSAAAMTRLEERLERFADDVAGPVAIVGQSRGGLFARALAVRRPKLVSKIVTLGSPHVRPLAVHPLVLLQGGCIAAMGALGVRNVAGRSCLTGECCESFRDDLTAPVPRGVRFVSVFSRGDGIVDWEACLDEEAECVEVNASHCGMGLNIEVFRVLHSVLWRGRQPMQMPFIQTFALAA